MILPLASFALAGCMAIGSGSDYITARDLAPALPGLDAPTPIAPAPAPGVQRVFHLPELRRLAARFSVTVAPQADLCFERPVAPLDPARLMAAMQTQFPGAHIQVLEYSRQSVPEGELEFPRLGLHQTPTGGLWNGFIRYSANHRFTVWARVKVTMLVPRVIAVHNLKAGSVVADADLREETREELLSNDAYVPSVEAASGKMMDRPVAAGVALRAQWLQDRKEVTRGDVVHVQVWKGATHLEFDAPAETSGSTGQTIWISNPVSKKHFPARVEGKGQVSVGKSGL